MSTSIQDIYDDIHKQREDIEQQNRLNIANMVAPDYDRAARIFAVEANTLLPYQVIDADLENIEEQLRRGRFDATRYKDAENGSPVFNAFAAEHPYHIAVLDRDWANLTGVERAWQQISLSWDAGWATSEINDIRDRQKENFQNPNREEDKKRLDELHDLLEGGDFGAEGLAMKVLTGTSQQIPIQAWLLGETLDDVAIGAVVGAARGAFIGSAAGPGGTLAGAIVGLKVGIGKGLLVGRLEASIRLEQNLAYDQYIQADLDEEQARWASLVVGGVAGAAESVGGGVLLKRIPGFNKVMNDRVGAAINSVLSKPTIRQAIARTTLMYGEGVAIELGTEIFQEAAVITGEEWLKGQARGRGDIREETRAITSEEFYSAMGDIAAKTLYATVLLAGIGPGTSYFRDSRKIRLAERRLAAFHAMGEHASKSETLKNAPSKYREFVERLTGPDGKVVVDSTRFYEYFQEQGMDPEEVAVSVGVNNLGEAVTNGHDIEIPAGQYLEKVAPTQHHNGLVNDLKRSVDEMSANEAATVKAALVKDIKEMQALQAKEDPEAARQDAEWTNTIKNRLIEGGMEPETAEYQSMVMVGVVNLARRAGATDLAAFQEERFGGVIFTTNAQMRADKEEFDLSVDPFIDKLRAGDIPSQRSIFGPNLIDIIKASGGLMPDSELAARDLQKSFRGLVREGGRSLDDIAEVLHEQGYIAQRDPELVLDALVAAAEGEELFGDQFAVREDQRELLGVLEQLERDLEMAKIDITDMTNKEVRDALNAIETYFQTDKPFDTTELDELTTLAIESPTHDPQMLTRARALLPPISPEQDFGDVQFAKDYTLAETDEPFVGMLTANKEFEIASERKNTLKALRDCLSA
jgi:hypothetical protein